MTIMRLITNLAFAQIQANGKALRLDCHALLLEESEALFGGTPNHRIRGFGYDSSLTVFTLWLDCGHLDYEATNAVDDQIVMISDAHPEGRPLFSGTVIKFDDGTELFLQAEDHEQPLDISDHEDYTETWTTLREKVLRYHVAPNFPVLRFVPKALA